MIALTQHKTIGVLLTGACLLQCNAKLSLIFRFKRNNPVIVSVHGRIFVEDFHDKPNISRFTLALTNSVVFGFARQRVPATV